MSTNGGIKKNTESSTAFTFTDPEVKNRSWWVLGHKKIFRSLLYWLEYFPRHSGAKPPPFIRVCSTELSSCQVLLVFYPFPLSKAYKRTRRPLDLELRLRVSKPRHSYNCLREPPFDETKEVSFDSSDILTHYALDAITVCYASIADFKLRAVVSKNKIVWYLYREPWSNLWQAFLGEARCRASRQAACLEKHFARLIISISANDAFRILLVPLFSYRLDCASHDRSLFKFHSF
jgi:hypothetical protein